MDSCAIGKDGNLLDAADIVWFNDPDDAAPLPTTSSEVSRSGMYADCPGGGIYLNKTIS
jgi:hypothetical protein